MVDEKLIEETEKWLIQHDIIDVEVMVSDFAGISRGKVTPRAKFIEGLRTGGHRVPDSLFALTINCDFIANDYITALEEDLLLQPDLDTLQILPWPDTPTACVICDVYKESGEPAHNSPRQVLRKVLSLYHEKGWQPVVAPEFEFFLLARQEKIESDPIPPRGRSGKMSMDKGVLSLDALDEFSPMFDQVYDCCDEMNIQVDTLTHEAGPAQFEVNVYHGDPLNVADQSFNFKRLLKQVAIRHGMFASFMAQPYPDQYGSAMHIHQSVVNISDGKNIFADDDGTDTEIFHAHIAGLQKYIPSLMPLLAPYANSYLRIGSGMSSPANLHWGRENRSVGLRVPSGGRAARRVENRIAGADVNPYLAIAASLLAGYLGMVENLTPTEALNESAYDVDSQRLPLHFLSSLNQFRESEVLKDILHDEFISTYVDVKEEEYSANYSMLSPWEIRYLLTNV
ncbi:glutamine synthetase family protein [Emcibacter sp.]|uniref:glutamine synthetase family protein n=1 Tax=Emcibacter sp. TaxID=1979954 RepID=UPI002AA674BE|nr:glutamine synthetase family protein [Emcibacter sp.]